MWCLLWPSLRSHTPVTSAALHRGHIGHPDPRWEKTAHGYECRKGDPGDHLGSWLPQLGEVLFGNFGQRALRIGEAGEDKEEQTDSRTGTWGREAQVTGQPLPNGAQCVNPCTRDLSPRGACKGAAVTGRSTGWRLVRLTVGAFVSPAGSPCSPLGLACAGIRGKVVAHYGAPGQGWGSSLLQSAEVLKYSGHRAGRRKNAEAGKKGRSWLGSDIETEWWALPRVLRGHRAANDQLWFLTL